ncbi:hypothetical protein [Rhodopila sp.]|uniref:hypothetical protein n=1 Tax=Rhodopila sp. TaxID=2480087 RepID=UPI003D124280
MKRDIPPQLDMTLEGEFVSPPKPPVSTRIMVWAIVIAIITGGLAFAALALWVALIILPVALGAAIIAWAMFRYRMWRAGKSLGGQRNMWSPRRPL